VTRAGWLLTLVATLVGSACEAPTLYVGEQLFEVGDDGGLAAPDARTRRSDVGGDGGGPCQQCEDDELCRHRDCLIWCKTSAPTPPNCQEKCYDPRHICMDVSQFPEKP
jgi:hypothetical protein